MDSDLSGSPVIRGKSFSVVKKDSKKKKLASELAFAESSASSTSFTHASCSLPNRLKLLRNSKRIRVGSRRRGRIVCSKDVDTLGLPLGMSIAAVIAQVLETRNAAGEKMSVESLSGVCILAVRESLTHVFGDKFDNFVMNFENSFRSTLMTLRVVSELSQNIEEACQNARFRGSSFSEMSTSLPFGQVENSACSSGVKYGVKSFPDSTRNEGACGIQQEIDENGITNLTIQELVLNDKQQQLSRAHAATTSSNPETDQSLVLSNFEKFVIEQTRSNDLKTFEIGLIMKKLQLKEKQLTISSDLNFLERWKLLMGFSKASFKSEKFKTQLQDARQVEFLRTCLDFLVTGIIIMLCSIAYGTYVYSRERITQITEACSPPTESSSWWMPKPMSTFNIGLLTLKCQIQVFSRMLFGVILIGAIALLLIQRSSASQQTMPITFILIILGVACGYLGKFCILTLGGSGWRWLVYWEVLILIHFFVNIFISYLYGILSGHVIASERVEQKVVVPYWIRRLIFYLMMLVLPLLCGLLPFASFWEWIEHFSSLSQRFEG